MPKSPKRQDEDDRRGRSRVVRMVRTASLAVLVAATFSSSLVAGLVLHLDWEITRAAARDVVNGILADTFVGTAALGPIDELTLGHVAVRSFTADTPGGLRVLRVEGVRIDRRWLGRVLALAEGRDLDLRGIDVETVEVDLSKEGDALGIAGVFVPKKKSPKPTKPPSKQKGLALHFRPIQIERIHVTGEPAAGTRLDVTLSDIAAAVHVMADEVVVHVDEVRFREPGLLGAVTHGTADVHLELGSEPPSLSLWGNVEAQIGALVVSAKASLTEDGLQAELTAPSVGADELAPWAKQLPLARPVHVVAKVAGLPPHLRFEAEVQAPAMNVPLPAPLPGATVGVTGRIDLGDRPAITADVVARGIDAALVGQLETSVDLDARVAVRLDGAASEVATQVRVKRSTVDGHQIGPLEGTVRAGAAGVDAAFRLEEDGAPTDLGVMVNGFADVGGPVARFATRTEGDISRATRLASVMAEGPTHGHGRVSTEGVFQDGELDASAAVALHDVRWPAQKSRLVHVVADARVTGKPTALSIDADVQGGGLVADTQEVKTFAVTARGPIDKPVIIARAQTDDREVRASGRLDAANQRADGVKLSVTHGTATVTTHVESVKAAPGGVALDGVKIAGLGNDIEGAVVVRNGEIFGKLEGKRVELASLSKAIGLPFRLHGEVELSMDLAPAKDGRKGFISAKLRDGGYLVVNGINVDLRADFDGAQMTPELQVRLEQKSVRPTADHPCGGNIGTIALSEATGTLDGALLDPRAWDAFAGSARLQAKDVRMQCVAEIWHQFNPTQDLPFARLEGVLNASALLSRVKHQRFMSLADVSAATTGLVFAPKSEDPAATPVVSDKLDVVMLGALDGETGKTELAVHLVETDKGTDLARLSTSATLDLPALALGGKTARGSFFDTAIEAHLVSKRVPITRFAALPEPARAQLADVGGDVAFDLFVDGTLRDPSVALRFQAWNLGHAWGLPTQLDVLANYHDGIGRIDAKVRRNGDDVAIIAGEVKGHLERRLLGPEVDPGPDEKFSGWVTANLVGLPLETLPPLARTGVAGVVSGDVTVRGLGEKPTFAVHLSAPELRMGREKFTNASVVIEPVPKSGGMFNAAVDLPHVRGGGLAARAYSSLTWTDAWIPALNPNEPAGLTVTANRFPLATLEPPLVGTVSRLGGTVSGGLRVRYRDLGAAKASVDVSLKVRDGVVSLPGQELKGISADISSKPSIIMVKDIAVSSANGKATGSMNARLDGLKLTDVTGTLTSQEDAPMPVIVEGVRFGSASGTLVVHYARGEVDALELSVADLLVRLPASSTNAVQELDVHPDVNISVPLAAPIEEEEVEATEKERGVRVTIALDKAVLEKGQTRIVVSTPSALVVDTDGRIGGEIAIIGGKLNLLGKVFGFDRGIVRLRPEESDNPYVNVTAKWTAPDGTVVFVDYVGLVKSLTNDSIRFRSVPPLSQEQILSVLLLGETGEGADRASYLTQGIAAAQFNALLGEIAPGLSTSFASSEGFIGTTLIYQLSDSITARATVEQADASGASGSSDATTGSGSDQTGTARTSVSVDWRFAPHWLLRGTLGVGQQSSSGLDVLYQFRY